MIKGVATIIAMIITPIRIKKKYFDIFRNIVIKLLTISTIYGD